MKIRPLFHLAMTFNLLLAGLPLGAVRAAAVPSAAPENLLAFTAGGHALGFSTGGMYAATGTHALHVEFVEANAVAPGSDSPAGADGKAAALIRVTYAGLWDGIDLAYTADADGIYATTYTLSTGADPADIRLRYNAPLAFNEDGTLSISFETGTLTESAPVAWQDIDGGRTPVDVAFRVSGQEVGFTIGEYDSRYNLMIDPHLVWNTFLGAGTVGEQVDWGQGIAVDGDGNVYVTGWSDTGWGNPIRAYAGGRDAFVAKMDSSGTLAWNTFLGGSGEDYGKDIAVDGSGNVYVGGQSTVAWGSPVRAFAGLTDAFAAKLSSAGALSWHAFLGSGNDDSGDGIAVDGSGNVYITGASMTSWGSPVRPFAGGFDAFIAKLNSSGALTWNTFLGGAMHDEGFDIAVDGSGNVYIAGQSSFAWGSPVRAFTENFDAFAAKLNSSGALVWHTFLGGHGDEHGWGIAVDGSGNVYVSGGGYDWGDPVRGFSDQLDGFIAKMDSSGALVWNTFLGTSDMDAVEGMAVDGDGNVYATGYSFYNWGSPVRDHSAGRNEDVYVAELDSAGNLTWNTFIGETLDDTGLAIAADGSGSTYITGMIWGSWGNPGRAYSGGSDALVVKIDSSAVPIWNTFLGGGYCDWGNSIAADTGGYVYVTGYSTVTWDSPLRAFSGDFDAFVAKLDSDGNLIWNTFLGGSGYDNSSGIAVDGSGSVYVSGESSSAWGSPVQSHSGGYDAFVAKINSSGSLTWNTFLGGSGNDHGNAAAVDSSGNVYLAGRSNAAWGSPMRAYSDGADAFAAKLSSAGSLTWNTFLGGSGEDDGRGIAVDGSGSVFVSGTGDTAWGIPVRAYTGDDDAFAAKLDSAGSLIWNTFLGGSGDDHAYAAAVDGSGNFYMAGRSNATWGDPLRAYADGTDAFAAKFDVAGSLTWITFLGGSGEDDGRGIAVDGSGRIFVAGSSNVSWGSPLRAFSDGSDAFAAKLLTTGVLDSNSFVGGYSPDGGSGVAAGIGGVMYVTGGSYETWGTPLRAFTFEDAFVAKLEFSQPGQFGKTSPTDTSIVLPNPTISWSASDLATEYQYCVDPYDNEVCDASWISIGTATSATLTGLENNTVVHWQVRAINANGTTYADGGGWWEFCPIPNPPYSFGKSAPANGSNLTASPTLNWETSTFADYYIYCVDTINNGICDTSWEYAGTATSAALSGLDDGETYYWFVAAGNAYGTTYADGGTWWSFNILPPAPGAFGKSAPANGVNASTDPTLTWGASTDAESYEYCVDITDDSACDASWISTGTSQSASLSGLSNNVTYYWQVRAANTADTTYADGGAWWNFNAKTQTFADVPVSYWAWSYIERLFAAGITGGCGTSPLRYCPTGTVTRAQMAIFLERGMNGSSYTPPGATGTIFGDVPISYWAAAWIEKLYADGITGGCGGGNYCPDQAVTRAQMAIFLLRSEHGSTYTPPAATGTVFGDVPISHWAGAWIEQLYAEGVTGGCGGGNFCPNQAVTRAEMAIFLVRAFSLP